MANPFFNAEYYLAQNTDVADAYGNDAAAAEAHYYNHGAAEGRKPVQWFDGTYYAETYSDLSVLSPNQLFDHFINSGIIELRSPVAGVNLDQATFGAYAAANEDLVAEYGIDNVESLTDAQIAALAKHFFEHGINEDRPGAPVLPVDSVDPEEPSELVAKLEAWEAAVEARAEAEEVFQEAVEDADLLSADETFAIADAADYVERAEDAVVQARAELEGARAQTFGDGLGEEISAKLIEDYSDARMTDARLEQLLKDAQAAVRADKASYKVEVDGTVSKVDADGDNETDGGDVQPDGGDIQPDGGDIQPDGGDIQPDGGDIQPDGGTRVGNETDGAEVYSAREIQAKLNGAVSALNGDINRNGSTEQIAQSTSAAIGAFLAEEDDLDEAFSALQTAYRTAANSDTDDAFALVADTELGKAVVAAIAAAFDGEEPSAATAVDALEGYDELVNLLIKLDTRLENEKSVEFWEDVFDQTDSGGDYLSVEEAVADRNADKQKLADAEELVTTLKASLAAYETADDAVKAAQEELGFEVVDVDDGIVFAEEGTEELFVFDIEALADDGLANISLEALEANDVLFLGSSYQQGGETGDNNVLEFFVSTNIAGDVVLEVEKDVYSSAEEDFVSITLVGVTEDQLKIDGGVISIGDVVEVA